MAVHAGHRHRLRLKQNIFRDDRRDVVASTRAALDYLQKLYGMFGDWQLALAAYNWGEGNVGRAIAKNQRAGLPTTYSDLNMPAETRLYVPKLQAVKNIVANPERFNADLPLIANHPYFQTVDAHARPRRGAGRQAGGRAASRTSAHSTRRRTSRCCWPPARRKSCCRGTTPPSSSATSRPTPQGQYASWTAWTVPTTMTVADAAQRAGMSETDLRAINNVPPRMLIKAGSTLIVPRSARVQEDVAAVVADTGHLSFQPEIVTRRTMVKAGRNDSVASIARRYKLSPANVAEWNDVSPTTPSSAASTWWCTCRCAPCRRPRASGSGSAQRVSRCPSSGGQSSQRCRASKAAAIAKPGPVRQAARGAAVRQASSAAKPRKSTREAKAADAADRRAGRDAVVPASVRRASCRAPHRLQNRDGHHDARGERTHRSTVRCGRRHEQRQQRPARRCATAARSRRPRA